MYYSASKLISVTHTDNTKFTVPFHIYTKSYIGCYKINYVDITSKLFDICGAWLVRVRARICVCV